MTNLELSQAVGKILGFEKVLGGIIYKGKGDDGRLKWGREMEYPDYSTDMNTAWLIIEAMQKKGLGFSYQLFLDGVNSVRFWDGKIHSYFTRHKHVPTAILLNANDAIHAAMALGVWDD